MWHKATGSDDKELVVCEGAYHELLHEVEETREMMVSSILGWIAKRL